MKSALVWLVLMSFAAGNCLAQNFAGEQRLFVQGIECRGNIITSCDFIRDRLYLSAGQPVDEEEIGNAKLRLSSLPNFSAVDIHLEKGSERGRARIVIEVVEANPWTVESLSATAARGSIAYERIAGRVSNENVFGTGKILSLEAGGSLALSGYSGGGHYARAQYVDPRLFDSSKYFLIAGAFYGTGDAETAIGLRSQHEYEGLDIRIGRRIFDFSYVTVGYRRLPTSTFEYQKLLSDGTIETIAGVGPKNLALVSYGWITEDDPFFPTRGSRFEAGIAVDTVVDFRRTNASYRQSWSTDRSVWTLKLGNAPGLVYRESLDQSLDVALSYSRPITGGGEIRRGRWYIEPAGESPSSHVWEVGIKAGIRLDTKSFGHVDIYVFGSEIFEEGDGQ